MIMQDVSIERYKSIINICTLNWSMKLHAQVTSLICMIIAEKQEG